MVDNTKDQYDDPAKEPQATEFSVTEIANGDNDVAAAETDDL